MKTMKLNRKEVVCLMRALLRSLEKTPDKEKALHEQMYSLLSRVSVELMGPRKVARIGRAMDRAIGR